MPNSIDRIRNSLPNLAAADRSWADRLVNEFDFAAGLAKLLKKNAWPRLIEHAAASVADALAAGRGKQLQPVVEEAEAMLAPIGLAAKRFTIHCVGHAHIDMNWMWSWPETVAVTNDTFLTMLWLMDEFDDFRFTQSQASVYRIVQDYHPDLLPRIRQRVAEGRWEVAAATWVEGEKNIGGGEALARHLLYTRRYMSELFGLSADDLPVEWSPDTFGHAWTIPTISSSGGVRCYYMCRGGRLIDKPPVFWWQGPDGGRILVNLEQTWYNDHIGPHNATAMLAFCEKTGLRDWMNVYGVGDHGGGPTRRDIMRIREMDRWPIFPNVRFATAKACFERLLAEGRRWPVIADELNIEFSGCYTSQGQIKRHNRRAESELAIAESAATLARAAAGRAYPFARLLRAWTDTLLGHFHDILPGSGVRGTREFQAGLFQQTTATTGAIKTDCLRALAAEVDTQAVAGPAAIPHGESIALGGGVGFGSAGERITAASPVADGPRPFVVFNPTGWSRSEVVTLTIWDSPHDRDSKSPRFVARHGGGSISPAQFLAKGAYWGHNFVELAVPVRVGPLGYASFSIEPGRADGPAEPARIVTHKLVDAGSASPSFTLENEFTLAEFDRASGGIRRLVDKTTGVDLARADEPLGVLEYVLERPGGMSAWTLAEPLSVVSPLPVESLKAVHVGPHIASIAAKMRLDDSTFTVTYSVRAGQPGVEIAISANWLHRGGPDIGTPTLRMKFPTSLAKVSGRYEIPFGWIDRDLNSGVEVPALRWAEVRGRLGGRSAGLALLNDSKHGHSLCDSTLRVTLIRSSYEPDPLPEIGQHEIVLRVIPRGKRGRPAGPAGAGEPGVAELIRLGTDLNQPLQVVAADAHAGRLPHAAEGVSVVGDSAILAGVKIAEDENAVVFRLQSVREKAAVVRVRVNRSLIRLAGKPVEVDLLERPVAKSSAKSAREGFTVRVPGRGIASVRVAIEE